MFRDQYVFGSRNHIRRDELNDIGQLIHDIDTTMRQYSFLRQNRPSVCQIDILRI